MKKTNKGHLISIPSGTTTESFMDEVERVNEVAEADEELAEDKLSSLLKCLLVK